MPWLGIALAVAGMTPLHDAVHQDDFAAAERLVRAGADVKAASRYGVTPLSLAAINGYARIVELLLKAGADPNTVLPGGESALMTAARTGRVEAVNALLASGADVHHKEAKTGQNALMWAAAEGHGPVVEALLKAGADPKVRLDSGFTAYLFAVREGRLGVVRILLDAGVDVNDSTQPRPNFTRRNLYQPPSRGTSALVLAVTNAHYELASFLLDRGAGPNSIDTGVAPLHVITGVRKPGAGDNDPAPPGSGKMTSIDMVRKLVAKGADVNLRMTRRVRIGATGLNTLGATPYLMAARAGDAELMRLLKELGADPLIPNADNATPLMAAAGLGTRSPGEDAGTEPEVLEAVAAALEHGNDINAVDNNGETAMHSAAYKNLPLVVELLGKRGAKPEVWNKKNKYGWTPLLIAEGYRFGNYKPNAETTAAVKKLLAEAGLPTDSGPKPVQKWADQ
jgi:ankyrin repeat protein